MLLTLALATSCVCGRVVYAQTGEALDLRVGDRIAVMGGGLPDRMQHDGWLEAYLQARLPEKQLVVRNLGFTGDELTLRMRSKDFGSPQEWLRRTQATVVFGFFGYNESFRDEEGVEEFKANLKNFVKETRAADAAGEPTRRVVLFSPIAYQELGDRLLPKSGELNRRLGLYTQAMSEVAKQLDVPFVDLFGPTVQLYQQTQEPLTINGVHLNDAGNREIARIIDQAMFANAVTLDDNRLEQLRSAVRDKNFYWYQRYRTTDGYSIFGGRKNTGGSQWTPDNEKVMVREMEVLDQMTANRDEKIWAVAEGKDFTVDDSNTPPLIPVATNKPGPLDDGSYPFLGGEEAIKKMTTADGLAVNLFASEEEFPLLQNPVQAAVDPQGRLWVAVWPSYPHWNPKDEMNDKLLIFEDTDGDGKADNCKVFADGLHNPTGFEFYNGGVYVAQVPDIWFMKDTDGDDVADVRERVIGGIDSADTHHSINSFVLGPGGGLYFQEGLFHRTQVETPFAPPVRVADAGVFRYDPFSQEFLAHGSYRFMNPHGHVFTYWGDDIVTDGTSAEPFFGPAISGRTIYPQKHARGPNIYDKRTRPCSSTFILSSSHFPEKYRDKYLVCNVIGVQGILQYELQEDGAGIHGVETEEFLMSSDPNFRPVDLEVGGDGALYVLDWQNPLIGHLQHNLRDSNRDHRHGRIYRVQAEDRELRKDPAIAGAPLSDLLRLLEQRDNDIRYRTKIELSHRPSAEVKAALAEWVESLGPQTAENEHHLLEALWVHQHHHLVNEPLLRELLASENHRVRAAAAHVLRAWREKISGATELVKKLVHDAHPRVRLAGALICSDMDSVKAAQLALSASRAPNDKFLDYTILEALRTLSPAWQDALASGTSISPNKPEAIAYLLRASAPEKLLTLGSHESILAGIVEFPATKPAVRLDALKALAKKRGQQPAQLLVELLRKGDASKSEVQEQLVDLLAKFKPDALRPLESQFVELAKNDKQSITCQGALASLARLDQSAKRVWKHGWTNSGTLDVLGSVQRIPESETRAQFYDLVSATARDAQELAGYSRDQIQSAALDALAHIPGHAQEKLSDMLSLLEQNNPARANALAVISSVAQKHWQPSQAEKFVPLATEYLATVKPADRTKGAAKEEMQLALKFAELLPEAERAEALIALRALSVRELKLSTIPHRMAYDQGKMAVQAGSTVQLKMTNPDNMPHNFVLTQPGAMAEIGMIAETEATDPAMRARDYVPESDQVLLASKLLQPEGEQVLDFQAPMKPGIYPYVCTYPGHWRRMFGALHVVENLQQYQANPKQYLAEHSLTVEDTLLKFNRPLRQWTYDELSPAVEVLASSSMASPHSFDRGAELFQVASCAVCHAPQEAANRFAPDLTKLDPKLKPTDILREILDPSKKIEEKYQSSKFMMDTGKAIVGFVAEETDDEVLLILDPLASCEPTILSKDEIEDRTKSELSLMPSGLLDRFTEEEIVELCAYIVARGDRNAEVYQQGGSE